MTLISNTTDRSAALRPPTLRAARVDDLAAVERLLTDSSLPTDGVAELFASRAGDFVVADDPGGDGLLAVAGLEVCCDNALLRSVAVRPDWRARGLGRELVRHVVDEAESRGLNALYLLTTTADHYFPRFGFERVARDAVPAEIRETAQFKEGGCSASAVAMTRRLGPPAAKG